MTIYTKTIKNLTIKTSKSLVKAIANGENEVQGVSIFIAGIFTTFDPGNYYDEIQINKSGVVTDLVNGSTGWRIPYNSSGNMVDCADFYGDATFNTAESNVMRFAYNVSGTTYDKWMYDSSAYPTWQCTWQSNNTITAYKNESKSAMDFQETYPQSMPYADRFTGSDPSSLALLRKFKVLKSNLTDWFGNGVYLHPDKDLAYYIETPTYDTTYQDVINYNGCYYAIRVVEDSSATGTRISDFNQDIYLKQFNVKFPFYNQGIKITDKTITVSSGLNADVGTGKAIDIGTLTGQIYHGWRIKYNDAGTTKYLPSASTWYAPSDKVRIFGDCEIILNLEEATYTVPFYSQGHLDYTLTGSLSNPIKLPFPTTRPSGKSFLGWFTQESGGTYIGYENDYWQPPSNNPVYAHWELTYISGFKWRLKNDDGTYSDPIKIQGNEDSFLFVIDDTTPTPITKRISAMRYLSGSIGSATIKVADKSLYKVNSQSDNGDYRDAVIECPSQALNNTYSILIAEASTGVKSYAYLYTILKNNGNTVSFEYNNGEPITTQYLVDGRITSLPTPTKKVGGIEYIFNGWMTSTGRFIDMEEYFVSSIVLYASWSKPATFDGRDYLILQQMTSDYDSNNPNKSHSRIQIQFNLGTIPTLSDIFQISCSPVPIPTETSKTTFALDMGISQTITISFVRKSPSIYDDTNEDSDKWSNRKWITELRKTIDRYQAFTDGLKLAYIPGDCKRYTINGRNYYFGKYMRMLGSIHDEPNFTVNAKSDLASLSANIGDTAYTSSDGKWYLCNGDPTSISNWIENTDNQIGQSTDRLKVGYRYKNAEGEEHWYLGINGYASSLSTTYSEGNVSIIEGSFRFEIGGITENYRDDLGWN